MKKCRIIFEKILPYILIAIFAIRLFSYQAKVGEYIGLDSSPVSKGLTIVSLFIIWFDFVALLTIMMRPFFNFKTIRNLAKFIVIPIEILKLIFVNSIVTILTGNTNVLLLVLLIVEAVIAIAMGVYYLIKDFKSDKVVNKNRLKTVLVTIGVFCLMSIPALPSYFFQFMFGYGNDTLFVKELSFAHRIFLYIGIIIPFILYFTLRNKREDVIRFSLIYLSVATMVGFLVNYNYTNILAPWTWPFHLCNTAMFIVPLCLIFRMKRLFYFTYFINVMGALFAMVMPNYDIGTNIVSMRIFNFWYNHWIAFFMPILLVALKQFKRPSIKEFYYSMFGFLIYFIIALVFNVVFSALGHDVDYFFLNTNFVADKLGTWAENIFNLSASFEVRGYVFEFHPLYQGLFFIVYVLLGLAVWFVYNEGFIIADNHYELYMKLKEIKVHEYAYKSSVSEKRKEQIMADTKEVKLEIKNVCKKYASSTLYAVKDASFEVHKGEIFGFLGPNGAGKSTIIKSIVGIQPITSGAIDICGFDITTEPVEAKYNIGYVPDHYALYEKLTGREYVNYIADVFEVSVDERNERVEKYIKLFELEHSIDNKIKTYSHGMKQKITIMAALVHNPKVWILDEPLTGLDPNSIYQVKECMKLHAAEGNIVFFSSHIIDIVEKLCQRIAIIKKGQVQCVKTIKEIEENGMTLEEFYLQTIANDDDKKEDEAV